MDITIEPHELGGTVRAVASKSMAHRILVLAALGGRVVDVDCGTTSRDIDATVSCLEALGARVTRTRVGFRVHPIPRDAEGTLHPTRDARLDCGESGSTLRFLLPVVCALGAGATITGRGRLAERPLSPLYEELVAHGARLSPAGTFPLTVAGGLEGGRFSIAGNVSSQFVSGLLLAAPLLPGRTEVVVTEPVESRAYVKLTLNALRTFGVEVATRHDMVDGRPSLVIVAEGRIHAPSQVAVEGDWSNSAFWFAAGAVAGSVTVTGLDNTSDQGDRAVLAAISLLGARVSRSPDGATVTHDELRGDRSINVADIPDLVPPLAGVAALSAGETRLSNAGRLRLKESDRLETVRAALVAMGADVSIDGDSLVIRGSGRLSGGEVDAANDHRIAMMAAVCGASALGPTTIRGFQCVEKSYPRFLEDFRALGGMAHESEE